MALAWCVLVMCRQAKAAREALESFMRDGMAWVDDQREPGKYWYYLPASSEKWSEVL